MKDLIIKFTNILKRLSVSLAIYIFLFFGISNYIESKFVDGSYNLLYPIYGVGEIIIKSNWGSKSIYTGLLGGFNRNDDSLNNIYYERVLNGWMDTYISLIYDNPRNSGIRYACDTETGEVLYCGCVSDSSRWCMFHIQY